MALFQKKKVEITKPLAANDRALLMLKVGYALDDYLAVAGNPAEEAKKKEREHVLSAMARLEGEFRTMFHNTHTLQGALTAMNELRKRL